MTASEGGGGPEPRVRLVDHLSPTAQALASDAKAAGTPHPDVYFVLDHVPSLMQTFHAHWRAMFDDGILDKDIKELVRLKIANYHECATCKAVSVSHGEDFAARLLESFSWQTSDRLSSREVAAMRLVDWLMGREEDLDDLYAHLRREFSEAELIELGWFSSFNAGTVKFVQSWRLH